MSQPIEVTTHLIFRDLLRQQPEIVDWHHYLTMARLVARALRLSTSTLIQTGIATHRLSGKYRLSYLIPALLWDEPLTIAIPGKFHSYLIDSELPQLQQWLGTSKPICCGDNPPPPDFKGLWLTDPRTWLHRQLSQLAPISSQPIAIDGADDLESLAQELLTCKLAFADWDDLRSSQSLDFHDRIIALKLKLTSALWQRPSNPYNCYPLDSEDRQEIESLLTSCQNLPINWQRFDRELTKPHRLCWAQIDKTYGTFTLAITPIDLVAELSPIWERQPSILITSAVDLTAQAIGYRQELGLGEVTSVKFPLDRQANAIELYLPRWMPMPNTSNFQPVLIAEIDRLLRLTGDRSQFIVILIQDTPLKAQLAAAIAAEWGTRVQVEQSNLDDSNILVSGWDFWQQHQDRLPTPQLLIIATLPIPSLEDPLVAQRVGFYKQQKQDWFRLYLLPTGLRILHRSISPMRSNRGIVAIFDNRIDRRIYGKQVLAALAPSIRIDRLDLQRLNSA
jgi:ATP-dependent DNA helicase DinG